MKKPKPSCEINKDYTIPNKIRERLGIEPYLLTIPLIDFCNPATHADAIPLRILDQINLEHTYLDIIQNMYRLSILNDNNSQLTTHAKEYLRKAYSYCSKNGFKTKFIKRTGELLKINESYLKQAKINAAKKKKRTAQEAELLAVDYTYSSFKQYRKEVLCDQTNTAGSSSGLGCSEQDRDGGTSKAGVYDTGEQIENDESGDQNRSEQFGESDTTVTLTKNTKKYILKPPVSCLVMSHIPKIQVLDSEMIVKSCALGIESLINNPKYSNTDEMKEFKNNQHDQKKNTSLSKISNIMDYLGDVLNYEFTEFLPNIWSHSIHQSEDIRTKQFANFIAYTLTDYHCNCKQPMTLNNNHERTPFVEYVVPMFKYLAKETNLLGFSWCEKLVETQKYAQIAGVDFVPAEVEKKYADGLGRLNNYESLFIESSSGITQENMNYTLGDTLKLICECNGALFYILSHFNNCNFQTALKRSTLGIK